MRIRSLAWERVDWKVIAITPYVNRNARRPEVARAYVSYL